MTRSTTGAPAQSNSFKIMALTSAVLAFAVMNGTMFNVAIPDIAEDFNLQPSQVSWVITSFTTLFAIGTLIYGKLADLYSIRTLYTISLLLFSAGSFIGFLSPNFETLIAARALQAMGAAAVPPLSFLVPLRFFPDSKGKLFGFLASTIAFSSGIGPIIGGTVGSLLDWRYIFLLSAASILAIPFFRKWFPAESAKHGKIDYSGALYVGTAVTSLLFAITSTSLTAFLLFAVFLFVLIRHSAKTTDPFIDPRMLKIKPYSVTLSVSYLGNVIVYGLIFLLPIMLRDLYDLSMMQIGWVLFPGAIASGLIGRWVGTVIGKRGGRPIVNYGLLLISAGALLISCFAASGPSLIAFGLFLAYLGFPLIQSGSADLVTSHLSERQSGVGMGLFNLMSFLAGAFSSAVFGTVLENGHDSIRLNPLVLTSDATIYSNIFFTFTIIGLVAFAFFHRFYPTPTAKTRPASAKR